MKRERKKKGERDIRPANRRRKVKLKSKPPENLVSSLKLTYATTGLKHKYGKDVFDALEHIFHCDFPKDPNISFLVTSREALRGMAKKSNCYNTGVPSSET